MLTNRLKDRLRADEPVFGTWLNFNDSLSAQVLGRSGFDFLVIDMEHGPITAESAEAIAIATKTTPALPIVRTAWNDSVSVQRSLDMGVVGAIVPYVNDVATARRVVADGRYPPLGGRSRGGVRSPYAFDTDVATYVAGANDAVLLLIMIETAAAVQVVDQIVALDGVDGVFVGPNDLSATNGLAYPASWDTGAPQLHDAVAAVAKAARANGKFAGILAKDVAMAERCLELGYRFLAVGNDVGMLSGAATAATAKLRRTKLPT
ncbi:MAG: HpcH/HpaI aldolase family protein [Vulcanimicrobiaceae bacterium]